MNTDDRQALRKWFLEHARVLPWRQDPTPYEVWVSEVMLQQTRVAVVIPYYQRWMKLFPTVEALAAAEIEDVIKCWEGLGYYSRARRLHQGARQVVHDFNGVLPSDPARLQQISGLGPYTIGAILSFAFKQKAAAVDGNVLRVLARYYGLEDPIDQGSVIALLRTKAEALLPEHEPWIIAEALIELGATVCGRQALCEGCPLRGGCAAYANDLTDELPRRRPRAVTTQLHRAVAAISDGQHYLLRRVAPGQLMEGLYEFPYLELSAPLSTLDTVMEWLQDTLRLEVQATKPLALVRHSFTRYRASLYPYHIQCPPTQAPDGYQWYPHATLQHGAFPAGHRTIARTLLS